MINHGYFKRRHQHNTFAIRWTGDNIEEFEETIDEVVFQDARKKILLIEDVDGSGKSILLKVGDWLVKDPARDPRFFRLAESLFEEMYVPVE